MALTAGAVRFEEDRQNTQLGIFYSESSQAIALATDCTTRLDLAWISECTHPQAALPARQ